MEITEEIKDKFCDKIDWSGVAAGTTCWNWSGAVGGNGYGSFRIGRDVHRCNRLSWVIHNGKVPDGLLVLHKCCNRLCVNPDHLYVGTYSDNTNDMYRDHPDIRKGTNHPRSKVNEDQVREMRKMHKTGKYSLREIGSKFGLGISGTYSIVKNILWKHIK